MEKEQPESMATIPMKADYAPSEVYSSEPPPAYHRSKSSAVQVARIVAVTIVLVSIILGGFLLASAYVSANASCKHLEQELQLLTESADRLQPLQPEALVQEEPFHKPTPRVEERTKKVKEVEDNHVPEVSENADNSIDSNESEEEEEKVTPIRIKLPLHLDLDDIASSIIDKNQRSKMNCIIDKKRAEEVVDHKPKSIQLPFGLNVTTDPRFEHVTGERMVIVCESGSLQRHTPPQQQQPDEQEETIMVQPVVIPYGPATPFETHMPQQMAPQMRPQMPPQMRPLMPPQMRPQMPHPMETLRPPMVDAIMSQEQPPQQEPQAQVFPVPNPFIQHIAQQLINQRIRMEMQRAHEEAQRASQEEAQREHHHRNEVQMRPEMPEVVMAQKIPIPDEVLRQINRLPNHDVIVSVSEEAEENQPEVRFIQQQPRQSPHEMNGRQTYARGIPVHIPVPMMQPQEQPDHESQQDTAAAATSEEMRPHYVQPRSIRSVDALLAKEQKRVKRCNCDCAC